MSRKVDFYPYLFSAVQTTNSDIFCLVTPKISKGGHDGRQHFPVHNEECEPAWARFSVCAVDWIAARVNSYLSRRLAWLRIYERRGNDCCLWETESMTRQRWHRST